MNKFAAAVLASIVLAACGSGLSGTYADPQGIVSYRFESGGKVYTQAMGIETEQRYSVEGGKVKVEMPGGANMVMGINKDGSLQGPMGIVLRKVK